VDDRVAFVAEKEVEFGGPTTLVPSNTRSIQTQRRCLGVSTTTTDILTIKSLPFSIGRDIMRNLRRRWPVMEK
jgi:hypothetical protein